YVCGVDLSGGRVDASALSVVMLEGGEPPLATEPPPPAFERIEHLGVICKREIAPPVTERTQPKRVVGVCGRGWPSPHDPSVVVGEMAQIARRYRATSVVGDRYAAGFVPAAFARHGIQYLPSRVDASSAYLELLPKTNSQAIVWPRHDQLLREARGLVRRTA